MSGPTDEWPKVVENEDDVCVYLGPGRVQLRAVRVGKGIEVTLSDRYNHWVPWWVMKDFARACKRLSKDVRAHYEPYSYSERGVA